MDFARDNFALKLVAALLAFAATFLAVRVLDSSSEPPELGSAGAGARAGTLPTASTAERIEALQAQVADAPTDPRGHTALGAAYLTRIGETEDPGLYDEAERSFNTALSLAPNDFEATAGLAELELSRHHFQRGLALALRAREINPSVARVDGAIVDGQIELGRYAAAERTLARYANRQPEVASYSRISYYRELLGDPAGALSAMGLAASAAGGNSKQADFAQTLIGRLLFERGEYARAERVWRGVLARSPGAPDAMLGLAAVEAGRGDLNSAVERHRAVFESIPAPDHAVLLGEALEAAGDQEGAAAAYREAASAFERLGAAGVNTSTELAVFEADHGSAGRAVEAGRRAWRLTPSVRAADAYSWALSAAGRERAALRFSREAMRLGSFDPLFLYHAGIVSKRSGDEDRARRLLGELLGQSPRFSPLFGPRAEAAFQALR
jgi:tetratricopeptide (TPR) repeat protein